VTVKLIILNRNPTIEIIASSTALILKALAEPARDRKKVKNIKHDGNISLKDVYDVARKMRERSQAREFSGTVCEILGTCLAVGCTVEGQRPNVLIKQIKSKELQVPEK
jgi:large subunit ribosomal protein L12e